MLHGIKTEKKESQKTLQDAQTNIVCILGTVPTFLLKDENKTLNTPMPIRNYTDLAKYAGENLKDYTMYDAIETVFKESDGATVYMINVFDEDTHKTSIAEGAVTPVANKIKVAKVGLSNVVLKKDGTAGNNGVDYAVTQGIEDCVIELKSDAFKNAAASTLLMSYDYADETLVTGADFVGSVDSDGVKTGAKAIKNITQLYGDDVNIIIAPKYSALPAVRDELVSVSETIKARTYLDTPLGTSVNSAVQGRFAETPVNLMCLSKNAYMAMPFVKRYNSAFDEDQLKPLSPVIAGMRVRLNKTRDIAKSVSNTVSKTIKGLEFPVEFILNKEDTESNALNAKGIATVINWKGAYRLWGARNCACPSETGIETFDSPVDVANFIEKTVESGTFECVDEKITRAFIDNVLEQIQAKFNIWKNPEKQIILDGRVGYDESLNPAENIANGTIVFSYEFCPPSVAETIIYRSFINIKIITTALSNAD